MNHASVCLLQVAKARKSLDAAVGTDRFFADAAYNCRQAIALETMREALEASGRTKEALEAYERSAFLFEQAGDGEYWGILLKSAAALKLNSGQISESAFKMLAALQVERRLHPIERVLKFILRLIK